MWNEGTNAWWMAHLSKNSDIDIAFGQIAKVQTAILCFLFSLILVAQVSVLISNRQAIKSSVSGGLEM